MSSRVECTSQITGVTVYSRGAIIVRDVDVPRGLASGEIDLLIRGITRAADIASVRAQVVGTRRAGDVRGDLEWPRKTTEPGDLAAAVRDLEVRRDRILLEQSHLSHRLSGISEIEIDPVLRPRWKNTDAAARMLDAIGARALIADVTSEIQARLAKLDDELVDAERALDAARLAASQARRGDLEREGAPSVTFTVRILGEGEIRSLRVEYTVPAARWWPAYTARLSEGATRSEWSLDAFVAQDTGEDWDGVLLALSTADLARDAKLPELPSLRLGRAQPAPRSGYRPAPAGLDALFESYDAVIARQPARTATRSATLHARLPPKRPMATEMARATAAQVDAADIDVDERRSIAELASATRVTHRAAAPPVPPSPMAMPVGAPMAFGGAPPMQAAMDAPARSASRKAAGVSAPAEEGRATFGLDVQDSNAPDDKWSDFDALQLLGAEGGRLRGRLASTFRSRDDRARAASAAIDALVAPPHATDPSASRGMFDHRYEAASRCDVPSDARLHRLSLRLATSETTPKFRSVPREAADVYREVELVNPFGVALLPGPTDVYIDGALLTSVPIVAVDRGGHLMLGLGAEDRIRVVRNARVDESSAGLLGGSTVIDHVVVIDVRSSLGRAIDVEVLDRIPVTDDKDVDVQLSSSQPAARSYDQSERGAPVRGGLRWVLRVPPAGTAQVQFTYRVRLPAKSELVGGNRRD